MTGKLRFAAVTVGLIAFGGTATAANGGGTSETAFTMDRVLTHWWVFPAAIAFSTIALASGVVCRL